MEINVLLPQPLEHYEERLHVLPFSWDAKFWMEISRSGISLKLMGRWHFGSASFFSADQKHCLSISSRSAAWPTDFLQNLVFGSPKLYFVGNHDIVWYCNDIDSSWVELIHRQVRFIVLIYCSTNSSLMTTALMQFLFNHWQVCMVASILVSSAILVGAWIHL